MRFLYLLLLLVTTNAFATRQETISADCLKIQDGVCITKTELGNVSGSTSNIQTQINAKADDTAVVHKSGTETITGDKLVTGQLTATSTTKGNRPCPAMNSTQMNAVVSPSSGDCVFNTTLGKLNIYDGTAWKSAGGGVSKWATATAYLTDDVVVSSNKLYIALSGHTSGTFATDLGAGKWLLLKAAVDVSTDVSGVLPLANGGTNKNMTVVNGGIVYTDADSQEVSAAGTSGQVLQSAGAGTPIWVNKSILGKAEGGTSQTVEEVQVPNNLLTQTGTNKYLHETGNNNLLANPSFEHSTATTGWTVSGGVTALAETTIVRHGKQSLFLSPGSLALDLYQDSALNQAQLADGGQAFASMWVKTSVTTPAMYVCPRQAGAYPPSMSGGCKQVVGDGKWHFYEIAFNLGGTSNGIGLTSNGVGVSGLIYVDKAISEPSTARQALSPVGPWIDYGAMTITATTTAPTKATTREKDNVRCRVNGQDYECIYEYRAASATGSAIGSGGYIFNLPSGVAIDTNYQYTTTNRNTFSAYDGLKAAASIGFGDIEYTGNGDTGGKCDVFATSSTTFQSDCFFGGTSVWMVSSSEAPVINQANAGLKFQIKFKGAGLSSNYSAYSTTNADYGFSPCALTGSWVTNATYTALCKRSGEMLRVKGKVAVTGAPTAAALTLTIPNSLTIDANKIPAADKEILGHGGYVVSGVNSYRAGAYYNSSTTVAIETLPASSAQNHVQAAVSNTSPFTFASGDYVSFDFEVPVSGWDQTSVAIGQFNGLESCADSYQCEGTYSAKVVASTGGVSDENLDWIAGNCTTANPSVCTFKTGLFTTTPNCTATMVIAASGQIASIDAQSATSVSVRQSQSAGLSANPFNLVCQKAGVDAVFKTARAVASDKNIQSIGSTGVDTQVVHFGGGADCGTVCSTGNCTICNQTGTKITSVSWIATGEYNLNGIDGTKYSCTGSAETSQYSGLIHKRNLSSSTFAKMRTGTTSTSNGASATAICIGTP